MPTITIPCNAGEVSDGYHTFDELYKHRSALFLALMKFNPNVSWFSENHFDGDGIEGYFIAGTLLPTGGTVTYHMQMGWWAAARLTGAKMMDRAPQWDGHTSEDVVKRLLNFACNSLSHNAIIELQAIRAFELKQVAHNSSHQPEIDPHPLMQCPACGKLREHGNHICTIGGEA